MAISKVVTSLKTAILFKYQTSARGERNTFMKQWYLIQYIINDTMNSTCHTSVKSLFLHADDDMTAMECLFCIFKHADETAERK